MRKRKEEKRIDKDKWECLCDGMKRIKSKEEKESGKRRGGKIKSEMER